jgi:uncharacterized Zn finger protein (UPF0148 family)
MSESQKIYVWCPECRQRYRWKESHAGERVRCAHCRAKLKYPRRATDPMEVLEPSPDYEGLGGQRSASEEAGSAPASTDDSSGPAPTEPEHEPAASNDDESGEPDGPVDEEDTYALAEDPDADAEPTGGSASHGAAPPAGEARPSQSRGPARCPKCNARIKQGAVVCVNCGFNVAEGRAIETEVAAEADEPAEPETGKASTRREKRDSGPSLIEQQRNAEQPAETTEFQATKSREESRRAFAEELRQQQFRRQEYIYPGVLVGVGLVMQFLINWSGAEGGLLAAGRDVLVQLLVMVPVLVGVLFASTRLGLAFGNLWTAIYKLAGMTLLSYAVAAVVIVQAGGLFALLLAVMLALGLIWLMVVKLFDLEAQEGIYLSAGLLAAGMFVWVCTETLLPMVIDAVV